MRNHTIKTADDPAHHHLREIAALIEDACYQAGVTAYENARMDGLCHEGAWECAVEAMRSLDFQALVAKVIPEQ